jgi:hypothetical protein
MVLSATGKSCSRRSISASSTRVMSILTRRHRGSRPGMPRCDASVDPRLFGCARVDPVALNARIQRIAVAIPTPNRSAAARRDSPASTAAMTRRRRSSDKVRPMLCCPLPARTENQIAAASGKNFRVGSVGFCSRSCSKSMPVIPNRTRPNFWPAVSHSSIVAGGLKVR